MARNAIVVGTGSYHPEKYVGREEFATKFGPNMNDFFDKTGINGKYICAENESSLDLSVAAAKMAVTNAGISVEDINLIILSTDTPAYLSPATSVAVQGIIGAKNAGTFDINCACAGFGTAMNTAWNYIRNDKKMNYVLVIVAYAMSKYVNPSDAVTSPLLGDGAGAIILKAEETDRGIFATKLKALGEYHDYLGIFGGGTVHPPTFGMISKKLQYVQFAKRYPATINQENWPNMIKDVCDEAGYKVSDINWTVFTQVNYSSIVAVHNELGIPAGRAIKIMDKYGYTGSACIPMAIHEAVTTGKFKKNDIIAMCASGGGANFASLIMKW